MEVAAVEVPKVVSALNGYAKELPPPPLPHATPVEVSVPFAEKLAQPVLWPVKRKALPNTVCVIAAAGLVVAVNC